MKISRNYFKNNNIFIMINDAHQTLLDIVKGIDIIKIN